MPALGYTYDDHLPADFSAQSLRHDVRTGLTTPRKWLPPKWFYDKVGSELFEDITALREYYPTRTERAILDESAPAIVAAAGVDTLVELGSGSSEKTRLLLDAMLDRADDAADTAVRNAADTAVRNAADTAVPNVDDTVVSRPTRSRPTSRWTSARMHCVRPAPRWWAVTRGCESEPCAPTSPTIWNCCPRASR